MLKKYAHVKMNYLLAQRVPKLQVSSIMFLFKKKEIMTNFKNIYAVARPSHLVGHVKQNAKITP